MNSEPNHPSAAVPSPAPVAGVSAPDKIVIQDFAKIQLRVAVVVEAKLHPNADKLLILQVDTGSEKKQIIAGIAQHYKPEELVGKKVVVVNNLASAQLRGETSQGMILAASDGQGALTLVTPEKPIGPGAVVR